MVVNKMKANEIRKLSAAELDSKLADLKKDLFMLRMQHATNPVSYTHLLNPNQKTVEALMSLDLPAGVEIEIKL